MHQPENQVDQEIEIMCILHQIKFVNHFYETNVIWSLSYRCQFNLISHILDVLEEFYEINGSEHTFMVEMIYPFTKRSMLLCLLISSHVTPIPTTN